MAAAVGGLPAERLLQTVPQRRAAPAPQTPVVLHAGLERNAEHHALGVVVVPCRGQKG